MAWSSVTRSACLSLLLGERQYLLDPSSMVSRSHFRLRFAHLSILRATGCSVFKTRRAYEPALSKISRGGKWPHTNPEGIFR